MSDTLSPTCHEARRAIGAEPQATSAALEAHLVTCADCSRYRAEMRALDGRIQAALEAPLRGFHRRAPVVRRVAIAASVTLATIAAGAFWLLRPQSALAGAQLVEHVTHEPASWHMTEVLPPEKVAQALAVAGMQLDPGMPVVYAVNCPFRGHTVPHLVVQTSDGPATVMVLAHEHVSQKQQFVEGGYVGVIVPAGEGAVAILTSGVPNPEVVAREVVRSLR